jgi:hypothetical protein
MDGEGPANANRFADAAATTLLARWFDIEYPPAHSAYEEREVFVSRHRKIGIAFTLYRRHVVNGAQVRILILLDESSLRHDDSPGTEIPRNEIRT